VVQKYLPYSCYALRRFKPTILERKIPCKLTNSLRRKGPKQDQGYLYNQNHTIWPAYIRRTCELHTKRRS
jgi:hypothetical protein